MTVGLDLNQPIQDALQPLYDAVYDELGQDFDVTGLIALALSTQYNNELLCPGETITLDYKAIDIKEILIDFDISDIVNTETILNNLNFSDDEEFYLFMDALGVDLPNIAIDFGDPFGTFQIVDLQAVFDVDLYNIIEGAIEGAIEGFVDPLLDGLQDIVGEVFNLDGGSHLDIFVDTDGDGNFDTQVLDTDDLDFSIDFNAPNAGLIETGSVTTPVNLTEDGNITARILLNGMGDTDIACPCPTQEFFHFGIDVDIPVVGIDVGIGLDFNYYIANSFDLVIPVNIDDSSPTLETAPQNTTVECDGLGNIIALQSWLDANGNAVALDDCPNALVWSSPSLLSETDLCTPTNVYQYEFTVSDAGGNSSSSTATFTIVDDTAPVIIDGANLNVECDQINAGNNDELLSWLSNHAGATASDVCGNVIWSNDFHSDNWVNDCGETRYVDVVFTASDDCGNSSSETFRFASVDTTPPSFVNCPGVITQDAETFHCDAYVDWAAPFATDNCDADVTITRLDNTGLNSGDRFSVGTTIIVYQAEDECMNTSLCTLKVIVNDYWQVPTITCPTNVVQQSDEWLCSAVVNNIASTVTDNCPDNLAITYSIYKDEALTERLECGVWDASGEVFSTGTSWVKYTVRDQPLLLISEISQSTDIDKIEITNFGPADFDISCLQIERISTNGTADETLVPAAVGTVVTVGDVVVFDFGFDGGVDLQACYKISYMGVTIDEVAVNGFVGCGNFTGTLASGDVYRTCEDDSNAATDWSTIKTCEPSTIGALNVGLDIMPSNGLLTSLQSIAANETSCTFTVTINDEEDPFCGRLDANTVYQGLGIGNIDINTCNQSVITVPAADECIIGDIVFDLTGTASPSNSTITLTSPYGTEVNITEIPADSLMTLFAQKSAGDWILDIVPNAGTTPTVIDWSLSITCIDTFDMADQTINNDPGLCGAEFTWTHSYFIDNCFEGSISVDYISADAACTPTGGVLDNKGGYEVTEFFCVGTTTIPVSYTHLTLPTKRIV